MVTDSSTAASAGVHHHKKDKILVIMGATGCGKTKVSIDLATRFHSEIINSDKIQVYKGLDIITNKIPVQDRLGVPHYLLGEFDPEDGELTLSEFRLAGGLAISGIVSRQRLPIVVGGSNSLVHALVVDRFNPELNVFDGSNPVSTQLRYNCCFLWVDVSLPVLCDYLCMRVDEMLDSGMFDELSEYYGSIDSASQTVLRKAIGGHWWGVGSGTERNIRGVREGDKGEHVSAGKEADWKDLEIKRCRVGPAKSGCYGEL
uniref:Adenylate isopentenyltransferase n=1 Tax=Populus trichocarpa TaxID=3694 RepID=B9HWH1_POPTR